MSREHAGPAMKPDAPRPRAVSSLQEVAALAGVSTASVSRALNLPDKVAPQTRARIARAAARLGYVPNMAARMLAGQRSRTVAAVVPTMQNNIFARGLEAIGARLDASGYTMLLGATDYDPERELHLTRTFIARGVDAMIFMGASHLPATYAALAAAGLPFVNQGVYEPASRHPSVGFDNRAAARLAVRHLLDLGHRRIAMLAGIAAHNDRAGARIAGLRAALAEAEVEQPPVVERPYTVAGGRAGLVALLRRRPRPTAIVCGNDILAFGALFEALDRGLAVPADLSIIGFDDLELCANLRPSLSSIAIETAEMGTRAAEYVLRRLDGEQPSHATAIRFCLRARQSTAPPGSGG